MAEEVRRRLLAGESNGEIAAGMGLKVGSVKDRCKWIFKKEGVRGRKGMREKMQRSEVRDQRSEVVIEDET